MAGSCEEQPPRAQRLALPMASWDSARLELAQRARLLDVAEAVSAALAAKSLPRDWPSRCAIRLLRVPMLELERRSVPYRELPRPASASDPARPCTTTPPHCR